MDQKKLPPGMVAGMSFKGNLTGFALKPIGNSIKNGPQALNIAFIQASQVPGTYEDSLLFK